MKSLRDFLYHEEDAGVIYCGDCLEIMPLLPENSIGVVVTSPPYGVGKEYGGRLDIIPDYWGELNRIAKIIVLFPGYQQMYKCQRPKITAIWVKPNAMTGGVYFSRFAVWEPILFYGNWGNKRLYNRDVFEFPIYCQPGGNEHPNPFPLKLIETLIRPIKADPVGDIFMGIGTTCIAAKRFGRPFIGIDIEEKYCEIAKQRLAQEELPL